MVTIAMILWVRINSHKTFKELFDGAGILLFGAGLVPTIAFDYLIIWGIFFNNLN